MIPFRDLRANRDSEWGYVISPGKTWISWRAVDVATQLIKLRRWGNDRVTTIETTQGSRYWWDDDDRHLHLLHHADGRRAMWKIDVENPDEDWIDVTPRGFRDWQVHSRLPDSNARIYIATRDRDTCFYDLYSVEPDGHGERLERRNPGHVLGWFIDDEGRIGARLVNSGPGTYAFEFDEDGDDRAWHRVYPSTAQNTVRALRLPPPATVRTCSPMWVATSSRWCESIRGPAWSSPPDISERPRPSGLVPLHTAPRRAPRSSR